MEKYFILWATLLSTAAARALVSRLVEAGFSAAPAARSNQLFWEGEASTLIAIRVSTNNEKTGPTELLNKTKEILKDLNAGWHSVIVSNDLGEASWTASSLPLITEDESRTRYDMITQDKD